MANAMGQYVEGMGRVPLLGPDDERELSQAIERGCLAQDRLDAGERSRELHEVAAAAARARHRFICANLRLVVSIARRYPLPASMELLDLVQEGNLGLARAVEKFDWRKGFRFSTYATFWIRQAIGRALDERASLVRVPSNRAASLRAALRHTGGDEEALDDEDAQLYQLTRHASLDRSVGDGDGAGLGALLAAGGPGPEQTVLERQDRSALDDLLGVLDVRTRVAVEQRFGLTDGRHRTYREVGEAFGVTGEAARKLVSRAVVDLREAAAARSGAA